MKRINNTVIEALVAAIENAVAETEQRQVGEQMSDFIAELLFKRASAEETRGGNRGAIWDVRKSILKAANRPGKRKREDDDDVQRPAETKPTVIADPINAKQQQKKKKELLTAQTQPHAPSSAAALEAEAGSDNDSWDSGESVDTDDEQALSAFVQNSVLGTDDSDDGEQNGNGAGDSSDDDDEEDDEDEDYDVLKDEDQPSWKDHVIMSDDDDSDDDEPVFVPPPSKKFKVAVSRMVLQHLQRHGTGFEPDEEDRDEAQADKMDTDDLPPSQAPVTPPVAKKHTTPPGTAKRVSFDMAGVLVKEFDIKESPAKVSSPRAPTGTPAPRILKPSPAPSPASSPFQHGNNNKKNSNGKRKK